MHHQNLKKATEYIRQKTDFVPSTALVLGSGLSDLASDIEGTQIPYEDIPSFPHATVQSHTGVLHLGTFHGVPVVAMEGRVHMYEGCSPQEVIFPMQVMAELGAKTAILTNATGGINQSFQVADLVLVEDHLSFANFSGNDPMRGSEDTLGSRFVSMNGAYSQRLLKLAEEAAAEIDQHLHRGVYAQVVGPTFETPAEIRALKMLGCDLVGMSTVPEVIAARARNMEVLAISTVTNRCVGSIDDDHITNEEEMWEAVELIKPKLKNLLTAILKKM